MQKALISRVSELKYFKKHFEIFFSIVRSIVKRYEKQSEGELCSLRSRRSPSHASSLFVFPNVMRFIQFNQQIELIREDLASKQQLEASYRQECRFPPSRATNPAGSFARSRG